LVKDIVIGAFIFVDGMRWKLRGPFAFEGKEKKGAMSKQSDRIQEIHSFQTIGLRWLFYAIRSRNIWFTIPKCSARMEQ